MTWARRDFVEGCDERISRSASGDCAVDQLALGGHAVPRCLLPPQQAVGPEDQQVVLIRRGEFHDIAVDLLSWRRDVPERTLLEPQLSVGAQEDHMADFKWLEGQDVTVDLLAVAAVRGYVEPQVFLVIENPYPCPDPVSGLNRPSAGEFWWNGN